MPSQRSMDKLRPASFRGVRFLVDTYTYEGGRRGPDLQFPDRDEPYSEDTGRLQRKDTIEAYLVGPDFYAGKKKFIEALEKKGPGDLVHPYYGRKRVQVRTFEVVETAGANGFVKITIHFVEAGTLSFPKSGKDSSFLVGLAGQLLGAGAADALASAFEVAGQADAVLNAATDKLLEISGQMDSISAGIIGAADPVAEFAFAVRNFKASLGELVTSPVALFNNLTQAFGLLFSAIDPQQAFTVGRTFFTFGENDPTIPTPTPTKIQLAKNSHALNHAVQTVAVIMVSNAAVQMTYPSIEDALIAQGILADQLDKLMGQATDDNVVVLLQDLRSRVVLAVPSADQNLGSIARVVPPKTLPSILLAYELYGSLDLEQAIVDRNKIVHPGFIQGGQTLEVLDLG